MERLGSAEVTLDPAPGPRDRNDTWRVRPMVAIPFGNTIVKTGWIEYGEYGIDGDVIIEAFDISSGTPVRTDSQRLNMRAIDGDYPYEFRTQGAKIDSSRGVITWKTWQRGQYVLLFQISGGKITLGAVTPLAEVEYDEDGMVRRTGLVYPANRSDVLNPDGEVLLDQGTSDGITVLGDGRAVYFSRILDNEDPSTYYWQERMAAATMECDGLQVTAVTWWVLEPGYVRYQRINAGLHGAVASGPVTFYVHSSNSYDNQTRYLTLHRADWSGPVPQVVITPLTVDPAYDWVQAVWVTDEHFVMLKNDQYWLQPLNEPNAPMTVLPAEGDDDADDSSWMVRMDIFRSVRGGWPVFRWPSETELQLAEARVTEARIERTVHYTYPVVDWNVPDLNPDYQWDGAWLMFAGPHLVLVMEYEAQQNPWNLREIMYVYGDPTLVLGVQVRDSRLHFGLRPA